MFEGVLTVPSPFEILFGANDSSEGCYYREVQAESRAIHAQPQELHHLGSILRDGKF